MRCRGARTAGSPATASSADPPQLRRRLRGEQPVSTATRASMRDAQPPRRAVCGADPGRRVGRPRSVSGGRSRRSRRRTPSSRRARLTFSEGVSSPVASVKSRGQDAEHLNRLGLGDGLVGVVDRLLDLGAQRSSSRRSVTVVVAGVRRRPASRQASASIGDQRGDERLPVADHHALADQGVGPDPVLEHGRRDVLAAGGDDDLLLAAGDASGSRRRRARRGRRCGTSRRRRSPPRSPRGCSSSPGRRSRP